MFWEVSIYFLKNTGHKILLYILWFCLVKELSIMKKILIALSIFAFIAGSYAQTIGEHSITALEESGITVKPFIYSLQYTRYKEFNNEVIPITVHASFDVVNDFGQLDSLVFVYNQNRHRIWLGGRDLTFSCPRRIMFIDIILDDFNFDGYMDIGVFNAVVSGVRNTTYEVFLYYPEWGRFYYHRELSGMPNLFANQETETISFWWSGGISTFASGEFKWENGDLLRIHSVSQKYDHELQLVIREIGTLYNGEWVTRTDLLTEEEAREH